MENEKTKCERCEVQPAQSDNPFCLDCEVAMLCAGMVMAEAPSIECHAAAASGRHARFVACVSAELSAAESGDLDVHRSDPSGWSWDTWAGSDCVD